MSMRPPDPAAALGAAVGVRRAHGEGALLPMGVARLIAFAALATFGAAHWAWFVEPAPTLVLLGCVVASACAGIVLLRVDGRSARHRLGAIAATGAALLALAVLAAGIAPALLFDPRNWDDLIRGLGDGIGTFPTARVPFSGPEEWTRRALTLGGTLLTLLAGLLAFMPRRDGSHGRPLAAAVALGALYAIPTIENEVAHPFLAGAGFALLVAAFLWLERVQRAAAPVALVVVTAACLVALATAPRLEGAALLDYEQLGDTLSGGATTSYDWNHRYGPLNWPRDGREVLRVKARTRAYWKAANLTSFDGVRWRQDPTLRTQALDTPVRADQRDWQQQISVTLRALRSTRFVAAGTALQILNSPRQPVAAGPGLYETEDEVLRRGNSYDAIVYTPRPSPSEMRTATQTLDRSPYPESLRERYSVLALPAAGQSGSRRATGARAVLPLWGDPRGPLLLHRGGVQPQALDFADTPYARSYALARRLRERSATPYDFMLAIERHLADGFAYSETPRRSRLPLESFLFDEKTGYCQQFSGAMALLLRLGGVPARVSSGFSPGSPSSERGGEYVVRDIDAHSWVEVYFPGIGWITRDPTPAGSPARSQTADVAALGQDSQATLDSESAGEAPAPSSEQDVAAPAAARQGSGFPWVAVAGGGAALALVLLAALLVLRARRLRRAASEDPWLADLRRALRRSGHAAGQPGLTLDGLAQRFAGTPAEGYLRALAAKRFGYGTGAPTRAQRAGLRRELARGRGTRGRLRAWWALPPQV